MTLGRALFDKGDLGRRASSSRRVLKGAPDNILASRLLAECLEGLGDAGALCVPRGPALLPATADRGPGASIEHRLEQEVSADGALQRGERACPRASRRRPRHLRRSGPRRRRAAAGARPAGSPRRGALSRLRDVRTWPAWTRPPSCAVQDAPCWRRGPDPSAPRPGLVRRPQEGSVPSPWLGAARTRGLPSPEATGPRPRQGRPSPERPSCRAVARQPSRPRRPEAPRLRPRRPGLLSSARGDPEAPYGGLRASTSRRPAGSWRARPAARSSDPPRRGEPSASRWLQRAPPGPRTPKARPEITLDARRAILQPGLHREGDRGVPAGARIASRATSGRAPAWRDQRLERPSRWPLAAPAR